VTSATQSGPPRARNGRFVKRRNAGSPRSGRTGRRSPAERAARPEGTAQLALLTLAIVLGVLGFALSFFWVAALVVLGALWGVLVAERTQRRGTAKGLAAEMVSSVVDEAKGIRDATAGSDNGG
jgi:hypothetical protein